MLDPVHRWLAAHNIVVRVPHVRDTLRHGSHAIHCSYFGAVWWEAHGLYAAMGGVLLVLGVLNYFVHFE